MDLVPQSHIAAKFKLFKISSKSRFGHSGFHLRIGSKSWIWRFGVQVWVSGPWGSTG